VSRVLVTGAAGFIGSAALRALADGRHEIHAVSTRRREDTTAVAWHVADLLQPDVADDLVQDVRPECLLHLAWYTEHGRFWTSIENVRWVEATLRLLRAFAHADGRRAIVGGTCAEYEWASGENVCSERDTPLRPRSLYGVAKNATREVAQTLAECAGFELAWGRLFFVYGPGETEDRLVPSVARALLEGAPAPISNGHLVRDFLHVDDAGAAFVTLLESTVCGAVNIGSGHGVSIREVGELIGAATGRPELLRFGSGQVRSDEPMSLIADPRRLRDEVGFAPGIALDSGLALTVEQWGHRLRLRQDDVRDVSAGDAARQR
jgi:nucleoside-diphosphate-sugar epimerase